MFSSHEELPPIIPNVPPTMPVFPTQPLPTSPEPIVNTTPKYLWGTPDEARHSVRLICDECGLSREAKDTICQVIRCESGFHTDATQANRNDTTGKITSVDYGICQMNSYWYIGNNRPIKSVEEALHDPEKCVRVMIKRYKEGGLEDWICYRSAKHLNYAA